MWVVLSEDGAGNNPSMAACKQYANQHGIDPAMLLIDYNVAGVDIPLVDPPGYAVKLNGLGTTYSYINPYLKAQGNSVSMGVPWNAVLKGASMEYYWSDYYDQSKYFNQAINEVLQNP